MRHCLCTCLVLMLIFFTVPSIIQPSESGKFNMIKSSLTYGNAIAPPGFANISGIYSVPQIAFQITLPQGWNGINLGIATLVSPGGIDLNTGGLRSSRNLNQVHMVLGWTNASDFLGITNDHKETANDYNASTYADYVKKTAKIIGCKVLSDAFVKINGLGSEKLTQICGSQDQEKSINYVFASANHVIFVGLKGPSLAFEHNLEKFNQSLQTIKIDRPTDIKDVISGFYGRVR